MMSKDAVDTLCVECGKSERDECHDTALGGVAATAPESTVADQMKFHRFVPQRTQATYSLPPLDGFNEILNPHAEWEKVRSACNSFFQTMRANARKANSVRINREKVMMDEIVRLRTTIAGVENYLANHQDEMNPSALGALMAMVQENG